MAIKSEGKIHLRSRNDNDFGPKYPAVAKALAALHDETVIDGEIVALDECGRPSFNALQNGGSNATIVLSTIVRPGRRLISRWTLCRRMISLNDTVH